jgi:hypothetical protein
MTGIIEILICMLSTGPFSLDDSCFSDFIFFEKNTKE